MVISQQLRGHPAAAIGPTLREIVVVVPAHNERDRLPACLASVAAAADQVAVPVTVVVVLDACTDRSEDAIARPVRALSVSGRNVGAARAAGFAAAAPRSDARTWLATTDADSVVPTTWLADQAVHHRALVQGVVGTVSVDWQQHSATTRRRYDRLYRVRRRRNQRKCLFAPRSAQRHRRSGAAVMSCYRLLSKPLDDNVVDGNAGAHRDQTARHLIDRRHHAGQRPSRPIRHDHQACRSLRSTSAVRRVRSLCPGLARVAAVRDGLWWTVRLVAEGGHRCLDGARGG